MGQALIEAVLYLLGGIAQPRRPTRIALAMTEGPLWRRAVAFILVITVTRALVVRFSLGRSRLSTRRFDCSTMGGDQTLTAGRRT